MKLKWQRIVGLTGLRLTGIILQTGILMLVGRVAGPAGVGSLQLFLAWTCSIGELTAAGLPTHAMRQMVSAQKSRASAVQYFTQAASRLSLIWLLIMVVAFVCYWQGYIESALELGMTAVAAFCFALYRVASESLKAVGKVDMSVFVESALPPLIAGMLIIAGYIQWGEVSPMIIIASFTAGFLVTAAVLVMRLLRLLGGASNRRAAVPILTWREHSPYWVTALVSIGFLNFPFLVLPYFAALTEIGAFAFAFKLLNLSTTILLMLSAIYGPGFARCAAAGDKAGARKLLVQTQQLSMLLYVPLVALLISSYQWIHPLFGEGFGQGFRILLVLAVGQLVSAMTGLSGQLLNMSGAGANEMNIQLASLLLALSLTPISGNQYGALGIAVVYSLTMALKSVGSLWMARRLLRSETLRQSNLMTN